MKRSLDAGNGVVSPTTLISDHLLNAATEDEKNSWGGWCEIESEPAFFNVMLRLWGVKGIKTQEVISLDQEMLDLLPRPVFGVIFLSRWKEQTCTTQPKSQSNSNIWFANQNACATIALLNIINNVPEAINLGEHLEQFKNFTADFEPSLRGQAIGNFEFVRQIHNSFARKMDMLEGDLQMKNDASKKRKTTRVAGKLRLSVDSAFHFNAFVPIHGSLWKLDGLGEWPEHLGVVNSDDWMVDVKLKLHALMAEYAEERAEFAILGVVRDPLDDLILKLAENVKGLQSIQTALAGLDGLESSFTVQDPLDWQSGTEASTSALLGPHSSYGLLEEVLESAQVSLKTKATISECSLDTLLACQADLLSEQNGLRQSIREEQEARQLDEDKAASRFHDYGPAIRTWLQCHVRKGSVKSVLEAPADPDSHDLWTA